MSFRSLSSRGRFAVWSVLVALVFVGQLGWLVGLRGRAVLAADALLIGGQAVLGAGVLGIFVLLRTMPGDAIRLSRRAGVAVILAGTVVLQWAAILLPLPGLSDDLIRYRLDARTWAAGVSPYSVSPAEMRGRAAANPKFAADAVDRMVSNPEVHTIYPPVIEAAYLVAYGIERAATIGPGDALPPIAFGPGPAPRPDTRAAWRSYLAGIDAPYRATAFRLAFAAAAVACTLVLLSILGDAGRSPWWAALFAWNPLVVLETGGMAHGDVVGVLFLLLCLRDVGRGRAVGAGLMLALAVGVKPLAGLVLPFACAEVARRDRSPRAGWTMAMVFVSAVAGVFSPILYHHGYRGWLDTVRLFSDHWEANGSLYEWVKQSFGAGDEGRAMLRAKESGRLIGLILLLLTGYAAWLRRASAAAASCALTLVVLLAAPVVYPWYLIWLIGVVPLIEGSGGAAALVWAGTASASYLLWHTQDWVLPTRWAVVEYAPVYGAVAVEAWRYFTETERGGGDVPGAAASERREDPDLPGAIGSESSLRSGDV